jgi:hypothetical protein
MGKKYLTVRVLAGNLGQTTVSKKLICPNKFGPTARGSSLDFVGLKAALQNTRSEPPHSQLARIVFPL